MPSLRVLTDGVGAWPDAKKAMWLDDSRIQIAALPQGMASGRASVAIRVDLPNGRAVIIQTSLRAFHAAHNVLVAKHGEDFMKSPLSEREHKLGLAMADLVRQLQDCKERLGEPLELNFETGDAVWDREQQLREALQRARDHLLADGLAGVGKERAAVLDQIDKALTGRKPE